MDEEEIEYRSADKVELSWQNGRHEHHTAGETSRLVEDDDGQSLNDPDSVVTAIRVASDEKTVIIRYADGSHETFSDFVNIRVWPSKDLVQP